MRTAGPALHQRAKGVLPTLFFPAYRALGALASPAVALLIGRRRRRGKEHPTRYRERWGHASAERPPGPLVWIHAASVGESLSVLPLIGRLRAERPRLSILMTSGTVTSARLLAERLPDGVIHQFAPLDLPRVAQRFIRHWRPQLSLFVESEIWPGLIRRAHKAGSRLALVNGRMSAKSFKGWQRLPGLGPLLLGHFELILAESQASAERFRGLGGADVRTLGNLKRAAAPLPVEEATLRRLRADIGERPLWLAASTHPGEEAQVLAAHTRLAETRPELLTILVPRHPNRGGELAALIGAQGLAFTQRSKGEVPEKGSAIYLADTLGELGLFYRLAPIVFLGGSLVPKGGQNLLEPVRLGCAVLAGPDLSNFAEEADAMAAAGALLQVADAAGLAGQLDALLAAPSRLAAMRAAASGYASRAGTVLEDTLSALAPLLEEAETGA